METCFTIKYSVWLLIVSIILQAYTSRCCLEDEKVALLQLKSYLMSLSNSTDYAKFLSNELNSWDGDGKGNCCIWNRVKCNQSTQHVTKLSLQSLMTGLQIPIVVLNVSLFQPFGELISLDLSLNYIQRLVGNIEGYKNLQILNFEVNDLDRQDVANLVWPLKSLRKLYLSSNLFGGNFPGQELAHLKQLHTLDLSGNLLSGSLPSQELTHLKQLRILNLSGNYLNGSVSSQGLCQLRNLEELILSHNELSGSLPTYLWNLTSLRALDISSNSLSGNIPSFINLPSLQWFSISNNNFQGIFSLSSMMKHPMLEVLLLSGNALQVELEDSSSSSTSKLVDLGLSGCNLINGQSKIFLKFLSCQSSLEYVDLSSSGLHGLFPDWLLHNNSNLNYLNLGNNSLDGSLQISKHGNLSSLSHLYIANNNFKGRIPEHIGLVLSSLVVLNMSSNSFEGLIPASISNMSQLLALDLSCNNFVGEVPRRLLSYHTHLMFMSLSRNNLQGEIIPSYMNLSSLAYLYLDNNNFGGSIKGSLNISTTLSVLDVSNNKATGELPKWIGEVSYWGNTLQSMSLARNEFHGDIPSQLCRLMSLEFLDLSENRFTGGIPYCDGPFKYLRFLHLHGNHLTGVIPKGLAMFSKLATLDLRNNKLSGGIPQWIHKLSELVILLLGGNQLEGVLPVQLCRLQHINIIDLSNNSISGFIPSCFENMSFGTLQVHDFDVYELGGFEIFLPWNNDDNLLLQEFEINRLQRQEEVEFVVKSRYSSYTGKILLVMSEIDLSCNKLIGDIPSGLGKLGMIRALNLSHNRLSGSIPRSFSKLENIESLDLSSNNLSGTIPSELVSLTFLGTFNVSYNNLSGQVPETGQFGTFDESSYQGNPLICGSRLPRSCKINEPVDTQNIASSEEGDEGFDMEVFLWSFGMSSITILAAFIAVLGINPYWRRAWFAFLDVKFLWWFHP